MATVIFQVFVLAELAIIGVLCPAIWFANALDKRKRIEDEEERKRVESSVEYVGGVAFYPHITVDRFTPCPICGATGEILDTGKAPVLDTPVACHDDGHTPCRAHGLEHLHMSCKSCKSQWFMKPCQS
jgi:hypothetical protein